MKTPENKIDFADAVNSLFDEKDRIHLDILQIELYIDRDMNMRDLKGWRFSIGRHNSELRLYARIHERLKTIEADVIFAIEDNKVKLISAGQYPIVWHDAEAVANTFLARDFSD